MSRQNNDGMAAFGCLAMLVLPFVLLFNRLKTPTYAKILRFDAARPQVWGTPIAEQVCPNCKAANEEWRHYCYDCGAIFQQVVDESAEISTPSQGNQAKFFLYLFFIVGVLIVWVVLSGGYY